MQNGVRAAPIVSLLEAGFCRNVMTILHIFLLASLQKHGLAVEDVVSCVMIYLLAVRKIQLRSRSTPDQLRSKRALRLLWIALGGHSYYYYYLSLIHI